MKRSGFIKPVSKKRVKENAERKKLREKLFNGRAQPCEAFPVLKKHYPLEAAKCSRYATDMHEVKRRSQGGSITDRENIMLVCRSCHQFITEHPLNAQNIGLQKWSWE